MKLILRISILSLVSVLLFMSCKEAKSSQRQEVDNLPGAYVSSEGESSLAGMYQEAIALIGEHKFEEAEILYREIIGMESDNTQGYLGLGGSLLYQDRFEEAQNAYRQALNLSPQSIEALIGLGSVHYRRGRYLDADEFYNQVLQLDEEVADAHWGRAIALEQLGNSTDAIYHYNRFIDLAPDSQLVDDAQRRIEALGTFK
jgi:tetratricopeptide (TPR) repeat protein